MKDYTYAIMHVFPFQLTFCSYYLNNVQRKFWEFDEKCFTEAVKILLYIRIRSYQHAVLSELTLMYRWLSVGLAQIKMSRAMPLQLKQRCETALCWTIGENEWPTLKSKPLSLCPCNLPTKLSQSPYPAISDPFHLYNMGDLKQI